MSTLYEIIEATKLDGAANGQPQQLLLWAEDAYRALIHDGRGLGVVKMTPVAFVVNQAQYSLPSDWLIAIPESGRVLDTSGAVVGHLTLLSHCRELCPGESARLGPPAWYWFSSPWTIQFDPVPTTGMTATHFVFDYTADVSGTTPIDPNVDLLLPPWVEPGLRAYIKAEMNGAVGYGDPVFQNTLHRWLAAKVDRMAIGQERSRRRSIW